MVNREDKNSMRVVYIYTKNLHANTFLSHVFLFGLIRLYVARINDIKPFRLGIRKLGHVQYFSTATK